jgi:hypothetical protein
MPTSPPPFPQIYGMEIHRTQFPEMPFYSSQSPSTGSSSALSSTTTLALQPSSASTSSSSHLNAVSSSSSISTSSSATTSFSNLSLTNGGISLAGNAMQTFQYTTRGGAMKLSSVLLDGSQMGLRSNSSNSHRRK